MDGGENMKHTILKRCQVYLFIFCVVLCGGCSDSTRIVEESVLKEDIEGKLTPIELYVLDEVKAGKYEPDTGIYTGAYVQWDKEVAGDILKYEALVGQKQTFKVFNYNAKEGISKQDILRCIAQRKVPYIKLILGTDYDLTPLYQMIFDLKESYKTPIFVELYPLTQKAYAPDTYKETFQRGYEILHKYLSDVVIVWSCDDSQVGDWSVYYPGDRYLDWAGMNIYIPRYKEQLPYQYSAYDKLDYWYKSFQDKKPMLLSGLAISHFSKIDHAYTIQDTVDKLQLFYHETLENYPRLKGIIYMDVNMAEYTSSGKEDYTITGHQQLIDAMQDLTIPLMIEPSLVSPSKALLACYQKFSIEAMYFNDSLYIPQEYMSTCFKNIPLRKIKHKEDLSGELYYDYEDIQLYCMTFFKA